MKSFWLDTFIFLSALVCWVLPYIRWGNTEPVPAINTHSSHNPAQTWISLFTHSLHFPQTNKKTGQREIIRSEDVHYIFEEVSFELMLKFIAVINCLKTYCHNLQEAQPQKATHFEILCKCKWIHDLPADVGKSRRFPRWNSPHIPGLSHEDRKGITSQYILLSHKPQHTHTP